MITVNKSVEIKKCNIKTIAGVAVILFISIGLMLLGMILVDSSEIAGITLVLGGIVSMLGRNAIKLHCTRKAHLKYRNSFFEELNACGFKCDEAFDSGALGDGDPAVMVVDYRRHEVGVMFYNNPESPYLIPARFIKHVWSGKDYSKDTVYASFGFSVNGAEVTVPTKVKYRFRRYSSHYSPEFHTRQRYVDGKCGKAFNESVEKADKFAKVLKKLTARYSSY